MCIIIHLIEWAGAVRLWVICLLCPYILGEITHMTHDNYCKGSFFHLMWYKAGQDENTVVVVNVWRLCEWEYLFRWQWGVHSHITRKLSFLTFARAQLIYFEIIAGCNTASYWFIEKCFLFQKWNVQLFS